jgi:hypothetical protein
MKQSQQLVFTAAMVAQIINCGHFTAKIISENISN